MILRPGHRLSGADDPQLTLIGLVLQTEPTRVTHLLVAADDEAGTELYVSVDRLAVIEGEPRLRQPAAATATAPTGATGAIWTIRQDAEIHDSTGARLGRLNEFFLEPATAVVTHLIVHQVHHLQHLELRIPIAAIVAVDGAEVRLDLARRQLAARSGSSPRAV